MGCLTLSFVENLLIWLVVIGAVVAVIKLLLPRIIGPLGDFGNLVVQILWIILWAIVIIAIIIFAFDMLACLVPLRR